MRGEDTRGLQYILEYILKYIWKYIFETINLVRLPPEE